MKKINLAEISGKVEDQGYDLMAKLMQRLFDGLVLFKKRKAEIVAGATTFFILMSFCPILLFMISSLGQVDGDIIAAKAKVLGQIKDNVPQMAPWIYQSLDKIIEAQISDGKFKVHWFNWLLLLYSTLGFISSLMFGINTLSKGQQRGGFFFEIFHAFTGGLFLWSFLVLLLSIDSILIYFGAGLPSFSGFFEVINKYQVLPVTLSLGFFTFFYKWMTPVKIRFKDGFLGAMSFVALFLAGKSGYWIYLHYAKENLLQSFGNFYTLMVAVSWLYFLMSFFYFGACVAYANIQPRKMFNSKAVPEPFVEKLENIEKEILKENAS